MKVFVYGTLKRGLYNHRLLTQAKYLGEGVLHDYGVFNMPVGYPGIKEAKGKHVIGEVYEVTDNELRMLDRLEGYSGEGNKFNLYDRELVVVNVEGNIKEEAYVYVWHDRKPNTEEFIESGRWIPKYLK